MTLTTIEITRPHGVSWRRFAEVAGVSVCTCQRACEGKPMYPYTAEKLKIATKKLEKEQKK